MKIRYSSAPCGSGKTFGIVQRAIAEALRGKRVIVAQPTMELIDRTLGEFVRRGISVPHRVIHAGTVGEGHVVDELQRHLEKPDVDGDITFITHAALVANPYWPGKSELVLMIDEELSVLRYLVRNLPRTHTLLTYLLSVEPTGTAFGSVRITDAVRMSEMAKNRSQDDLLKVLSDVARTLDSPHWNTFVNLEQYNKVLSGVGQRLAFHSFLDPSIVTGFGSVFMAAADFRHTAIYKIWSRRGVIFVEDQQFGEGLRFTEHTNGPLLTIFHADQTTWSKKRADTSAGHSEETALELMIAAARGVFAGSRFLWQANVSYTKSPFGAEAERLPNKPHGLNGFFDVDGVVFLSALNPSPDHFRFLKMLGLTGDEVRDAIYHAAAYQSVMRTSLRDPASQTPKRIMVPNSELALYLQGRFPGSRLEELDIGLAEVETKKSGRPRKHQSGKDRSKAHRSRSREKQMALINDLVRMQDAPEDRCGGKRQNETTIDIITNNVTPHAAGTNYSHKKATTPAGYINPNSDNDFLRLLYGLSQRTITTKEEAGLISPAVFDPNLIASHSRARGNIVHLRHLWLDFENGNLRPEDIPGLFPNLQMVVTNSFNHTNEEPRFRVIIPTTQNVTPDVHELLFDGVVQTLEEAGYAVPTSRKDRRSGQTAGLDRSKRNATSLFYAPSRARDAGSSFFHCYDETPRTALDPISWVENGRHLIQPEVETRHTASRPVPYAKLDAVEAAIAEWRSASAFPGEGNERFFRFALALRSGGLDIDQIEEVLQSEFQFARSPAERHVQIPSIMSSLRQSWR